MNRAFFREPFVFAFLLYSLLVLIWNGILHVLPSHTTIWNYGYNIGYGIIYLAGTFAGIYGATRMALKSTIGKSLLFLGLGQAGYGIGLMIWSYFNLIARVDIPYPSLADGFFLLVFIPCMAIGCWYELAIFTQLITKRRILMAILAFLAISALIFGWLNKPDISAQLPVITRIFNVLYPLGDSILLTLAVLALGVSGGKMHTVLLLLSVGFFFQVSGDMLFSYRSAKSIYWNGDIADTCFTTSAILLTLGIRALFFLTRATPGPATLSPQT